jgi:hypothetical protein
MKVYYHVLGGHVHMRVFLAGGKMGDLVCKVSELAQIKSHFMRGATFIEEIIK